jgi:site-specific recombinase XerD
MPHVERKVLHALTAHEVGRVLRVCNNPRDKALIGFLLDTGVRAAEACSLNVGDVETRSGAVTVTQGKGQKGRIVYLGAAGRKTLRRYLMQRGNPPPTAALFVALRGGTRLTVNAIVQLMRRMRGRAGVPHLTAHALRRTFAIQCLRSGMDIHTLRMLMGHTDIDVLRRYLDFAQADLQAAHARHSPLDSLTT